MQQKLEKLGIHTIVPDFWDDDIPSVDHWQKIFQQYEQKINNDTILIGHSLWGAFLLKFLEKFQKKVYLLVTVWSPIGIKPIKFYDGDYDFLDGFDFDWDSIRDTVNNQIVIHSDNDPYVSIGNGEILSQELGVDLLFIPDAWHFNESAWYTEFPKLLEEIKTYL